MLDIRVGGSGYMIKEAGGAVYGPVSAIQFTPNYISSQIRVTGFGLTAHSLTSMSNVFV